MDPRINPQCFDSSVWPRSEIGKCAFLLGAFRYVPSTPISYMFGGLFLLVAALLAIQTIRYRSKHSWVLVFAATLEGIFFIVRGLAADKLDRGMYIGQRVVILLVPVFQAFVAYALLGKLLTASGRPILGQWLTPQRLGRIFVAVDIITFLLKAQGGGMMAADPDKWYSMGQMAVVSSLAITLVVFTFYLFVLRKLRTDPSYGIMQVPQAYRMTTGLMVAMVLLYNRTIFRIVEFGRPRSDPIDVEWPFLVFEAAGLWFAFISYIWWHAGQALPDQKAPAPAEAFATAEKVPSTHWAEQVAVAAALASSPSAPVMTVGAVATAGQAPSTAGQAPHYATKPMQGSYAVAPASYQQSV